jgi:HD-like signal output (HDOD) protein
VDGTAEITYTGSVSRQKALECLRKLPAMSASAGRLLGRLSKRDCDLVEVAALIEKDPVLSAQVVQSANSANFSRAHHVESVRHAIVMVGVGTVRKFALVRTLSNLFSRRSPAATFSMTRFNLHSVAMGAMLELLADEVPLEYSEGAFLSGLFHDVGTLLIAFAMPKQYESTLALAAVTGQGAIECEQGVLGTDHAELSALALERWGMAEPIRNAAAWHHSPETAPQAAGSLAASAARVPLSLALHQVDALIDGLGMSVEPHRAIAYKGPSLEFPGYGLNQTRLLERFAMEWKAIDAMLR